MDFLPSDTGWWRKPPSPAESSRHPNARSIFQPPSSVNRLHATIQAAWQRSDQTTGPLLAGLQQQERSAARKPDRGPRTGASKSMIFIDALASAPDNARLIPRVAVVRGNAKSKHRLLTIIPARD